MAAFVTASWTTLNTTSISKFLGVTIVRALSFGPPVDAEVFKASSRCRVFASLTPKRRDWRTDQLIKVYRGLHFSVIHYAALAWQPWLAPTRLDQQKRCQNRALRFITEQLKTTPLEALWIETGVPSIATPAQQQAAMPYEKVHRLPTNHPHITLLEEPCRHHFKRPSWRSAAKALTCRLPDALFSRNAFQTRDNGGCFQKAHWHPRTANPRRASKPSAF